MTEADEPGWMETDNSRIAMRDDTCHVPTMLELQKGVIRTERAGYSLLGKWDQRNPNFT